STIAPFTIRGRQYRLKPGGDIATGLITYTSNTMTAIYCTYNGLSENEDFKIKADYPLKTNTELSELTNNEWESFNPYTNVLWLHYILDKMINECYYKNIKTKVHKTNLATLKQIKDRLLQYKSATDYIQNE
ncbi:unnamed protein product, partial [Meganyctiphanes norvegica]